MKKKSKLEKKLTRNKIIGMAFGLACLSSIGLSAYKGISSYCHVQNENYNAAIADGAISLSMLPLSFAGYYSSKRILTNKKLNSKKIITF